MSNEISVFLSHSHKDVDKVRKIRDILETLNCEPLMFFLKCLDDDSDTLENFIKREIEARYIFIYCKSSNAEQSRWVQKELEYIKTLDQKRLYTIDIDNMLYGLSDLLRNLVNIIYKNNIFIYSLRLSDNDRQINDFLVSKGYKVEVYIENTDKIDGIPTFRNISSAHEINEFQKYKEYLIPVLEQKRQEIIEKIKYFERNGIFMPIVHDESLWTYRFLFDNVLDVAAREAEQHNLKICTLCYENAVSHGKPDIVINKEDFEKTLDDLYRVLTSYQD